MYYITGKFSGLYVGKLDKDGKSELVSDKKEALKFKTKEAAQEWFIKNRAASFLIVEAT